MVLLTLRVGPPISVKRTETLSQVSQVIVGPVKLTDNISHHGPGFTGCCPPATCSLGQPGSSQVKRVLPVVSIHFSLFLGPSPWPYCESSRDVMWGALGRAVPHHPHPSPESTVSLTPSLFWGEEMEAENTESDKCHVAGMGLGSHPSLHHYSSWENPGLFSCF